MVRTVSYEAYGSGTDLTHDTTDIDPTITAGDEGVEDVIEITVAASGSSDWYNTRGVQTVVLVATGAAKFYAGNADHSIVREYYLGGVVQHPSATKCGIIAQTGMPPSFKITDTSGSSNPMTIYFNRGATYTGGGQGTV